MPAFNNVQDSTEIQDSKKQDEMDFDTEIEQKENFDKKKLQVHDYFSFQQIVNWLRVKQNLETFQEQQSNLKLNLKNFNINFNEWDRSSNSSNDQDDMDASLFQSFKVSRKTRAMSTNDLILQQSQLEQVPEEIDRDYIRNKKIDTSRFENRQLLHKVKTNNWSAKAWWQFAISSVIRDNRQLLKGETQKNEFQISPITKQMFSFTFQNLCNQILIKNDKLQGQQKEKSSKKSDDFAFTLNLQNLLDSQIHIFLFQHCIISMKQEELEQILTSSINNFIVTKGLEENRVKLISQKAKDLKKQNESVVQIQTSVKQSYGASIRSYMSYWSGYQKNEIEEGKKEDEISQEMIETAVEQAALEEIQKEEAQDQGLQEEAVVQGVHWFALNIKVSRGSVFLDSLLPNQSLLLHFKNNEGTWVKKKYGHFVKISTEDWGINNLIFQNSFSEPKIFPLIEVKKEKSKYSHLGADAWNFELAVNSQLGSSMSDQIQQKEDYEGPQVYIRVFGKPVQINYEPEIIKNLISFFSEVQQKDKGDEVVRAQALDKLMQVQEWSQDSLRDMLEQERMFQVECIWEQVSVFIPFKAHNSKYLNEPEDRRQRSWEFNLGELEIHTENSYQSIDDVYQRLKVKVGALCIKFHKQDINFNFLEDVNINFLIEMKSKVRTIIYLDKLNKQNIKDSHSQIYDVNNLPKIRIKNIDTTQIVVVNFTPDAFNSIVNISTVFYPEMTRDSIRQQISEKQAVVSQSIFVGSFEVSGVREYYRITNNWKFMFVVIQGSYIYFYKQESDLIPYHYIYLLSTQVIDLSKSKVKYGKQSNVKKDVHDSLKKPQGILLKTKNGEQIFIQIQSQSKGEKKGQESTFSDSQSQKVLKDQENEEKKNNFIQSILRRQQELRRLTNTDEGEEEFNRTIQQNDKVSSANQFQPGAINYQESSFKLTFVCPEVKLRLFKEDIKNSSENLDSHPKLWTVLQAKALNLDYTMLAFQTNIGIQINYISVSEFQRLSRQLILIPGQSFINITTFSINSPTIKDAEMEVEANFFEKAVILWEPTFFNELLKYLRNIGNQDIENYRDIQADLISQMENQFDKEEVQKDEKIQKQLLLGQTCEEIETILVKTIVKLEKGLQLIGVHPEYAASIPVMEFCISQLSVQYSMMIDHDDITMVFLQPSINDLSCWPMHRDLQDESDEHLKFVQQMRHPSCLKLDLDQRRKPIKDSQMLKNRQNILVQKDENCQIEIKTKIFYPNCPQFRQQNQSETLIKMGNFQLYYYSEQLIRFFSYLNEQFLYSATQTDPYPTPQDNKVLLEKEINELQNLNQQKLLGQFNVYLNNISVILKERPYWNEEYFELSVKSIEISQKEITQLGRHTNLKNLEMLLTVMLYEIKGLEIEHIVQPNQRLKISNELAIDFTMTQPNYSELLSKINSEFLDKSSEILVQFKTDFKLQLTQEAYIFIMKLNALNLGFTDKQTTQFTYTRVDEIFQTKKKLPYMTSKFQTKNLFCLMLIQNEKEIIEARLQARQGIEKNKNEFLVVEQFLDGSMKINFKMGIPTLLDPIEIGMGQENLKSNLDDEGVTPKALLLGSESDPHIFFVNKNFLNNEDQANVNNNSQNKDLKCGELQFKWKWASNGEQIQECQIRRAKLFLRPFCLLKLSHFFNYGQPDFCYEDPDTNLWDLPNSWETDMEKLPILRTMIKLQDIMICVDSFHTENLLEFKQNQQFFNDFIDDQSDQPSFADSFVQSNENNEDIAGRSISSNQLKAKPIFQEISKEASQAGSKGQGAFAPNFTTIVCRVKQIEYYFVRFQIQQIKEDLFLEFKNFNKNKLEEIKKEGEGDKAVDGENEFSKYEDLEKDEISLAVRKSMTNDVLDFGEKKKKKMSLFESRIDEQTEQGNQVQTLKNIAEKKIIKMQLKISNFSPYFVDNLELDSQIFENIKKRQLISPIEIKYNNYQLLILKVKSTFEGEKIDDLQNQEEEENSEEDENLDLISFNFGRKINQDPQLEQNKIGKFVICYKNSVEIDKAQIKVTFSDLLMLQDASTIMSQSQARFDDYFFNFKVEQQQQESKNQRQLLLKKQIRKQNKMIDSEDEEPSDEERQSQGSRLVSGGAKSEDTSFASLKPDEIDQNKLDQKRLVEIDKDYLKKEASQQAQQMRNNMINYFTSFSSQQRLSSTNSLSMTGTIMRASQDISTSFNQTKGFKSRLGTIANNDNTIYEQCLDTEKSESKGRSSLSNIYRLSQKRMKGSQRPSLKNQFTKDFGVIEEEDQEIEDKDEQIQNKFTIINTPKTEEEENSADFYSLKYSQEQSKVVSRDRSKKTNEKKDLDETMIIDSTMKAEKPREDNDQAIKQLLDWNIVYSDEEGMQSQIEFFNGVNVEGLHLMILNDSDKVFYPIMQAHIEKFQFLNDNRSQIITGNTEIKMMISYYNNRIDVWEPFLEITTIRISLTQDYSSSQIYCMFKEPVCLNITEELIENLANAQKTLQKTQKAMQKFKEDQKIDTEYRRSSIRQSVRTSTRSRQPLQKLEVKKTQTINKCNLEFKVTPYKIVNNTPNQITIIRQKQQKKVDGLIASEYLIESRQSVDYEVDYEQEAKKLMLSSQNDLVHKHDFINIQPQGFDQVPQDLVSCNLANSEPRKFKLSDQAYHYIVFGREINEASLVKKSYIIRSPFIIFNKTSVTFVLKVCAKKAKVMSSDDQIVILEPGEGLPIKIEQIDKQVVFTTKQDYQELEGGLGDPDSIWSQHFKISNFFNKSAIQKKKFTIYHNKKFSQVHVQPSSFGQLAWDICIKVPVVIRNCLPFNLRIQTNEILSCNYSLDQKTGKKKRILETQVDPIESVIFKQGRKYFHNFNLEDSVVFNMAIDIPLIDSDCEYPYLLDYTQFALSQNQYKDTEKEIELRDVLNQQTITIGAKIQNTDQCDLEIIFFCYNYLVNNTDQKLYFWKPEKKKPLACQNNNSNNAIIPVCKNINKVVASIISEENSKNFFSQPFHINIVGPQNQINIQKRDQMHYPFIVNTEASLIAPDLSMYINVTTINPIFVICNNTKNTLLIAQVGFQDRKVEVIPSQKRMGWYWADPKGKLQIVFKFTPEHENNQFKETAYEWSKKIKLLRPGRISILSLHKSESCQNKLVRVTKQICAETTTTFVVFNEEDKKNPTYKLINKSQNIHIECSQILDNTCSFNLRPGDQKPFSWLDPEIKKAQKRLLEVVLRNSGPDGSANQVISKKLIDFEQINSRIELSFEQQIFDGEENEEEDEIDDFKMIQIQQEVKKRKLSFFKKKVKKQKILQKVGNTREKKITLEVITDGFTKSLVLTEIFSRQKINSNEDDFQVSFDSQAQEQKQKKADTLTENLTNQEVPSALHQKESKFHLDIQKMLISFIATSQPHKIAGQEVKFRKEFLLACFTGTTFLMINNPRYTDFQFRISDFQIDNNSAFNEHQIYPIFIYPKELFQQRVDNKAQKRNKNILRKEFFNLHLTLKKNSDYQNKILFLHRVEILLQSFVMKADEQLITWICKFVTNLASSLENNLTKLHVALEPLDQRQTLQSAPDFLFKNQSFIQQNNSVLQDDQDMAFGDDNLIQADKSYKLDEKRFSSQSSYRQSVNLRLKQQQNQSIHEQKWSVFPEKRGNVIYLFSTVESNSQILKSDFAFDSQFSWFNYKIDSIKTPIFIEKLVIGPIEIEISFKTGIRDSLNVGMKMEQSQQKYFSVANCEDSLFRLNNLEINNFYGSSEDFQIYLYNQYRNKIIQSALQIFLTSSFGINLFFHDVANGAKDVFYKPIEGFIEGPLEGGRGLAIGVASLVGNTLGGFMSLTSRFSNKFSSGFVLLAADDEFIEKREEAKSSKAKTEMQGLAQGGRMAGLSIKSGLVGVVQKPYQGLKEEGIKGLGKGTIKGVSGLIGKTGSGVFDLFSKTFEGVGNRMKTIQNKKQKNLTTSEMIQQHELNDEVLEDGIPLESQMTKIQKSKDTNEVQKIRMFRPFYSRMQRIKAYHEFHALVAVKLKYICNQEYANDQFLDVLAYEKENQKICLIMTEERILIVDAITQKKIHDLPRNILHIIKTREIFKSREDQQSGDFLVEEQKFVAGYELIIWVQINFDDQTSYLLQDNDHRHSNYFATDVEATNLHASFKSISHDQTIHIQGHPTSTKLPDGFETQNYFDNYDYSIKSQSLAFTTRDTFVGEVNINSPIYTKLFDSNKSQMFEGFSSRHTVLDYLQQEKFTESQYDTQSFEVISRQRGSLLKEGFVIEIKDQKKLQALKEKLSNYLIYVKKLNKHK